jgi:hypothetical protein
LQDTSLALSPAERLRLQEVVGTLLYYERAIDSTMLVALETIAAAKTTYNNAKALTHLLIYAATNPDAILQYNASDIVYVVVVVVAVAVVVLLLLMYCCY